MQCTPESTKSVITANKSSKKLTLIRCANLNTKCHMHGYCNSSPTYDICVVMKMLYFKKKKYLAALQH